MDAQRTVRRQISCVGIGLHSGNKVHLSLKPAAAGSGIRFRRTDRGDHEVPATIQHLAGIQLATGLARNDVSVETVEHLMAALVAMGVDNVLIELNSPEVPIMAAARPLYHRFTRRACGSSRPAEVLKARPIAFSAATSGSPCIRRSLQVTTASLDHPLLRHIAKLRSTKRAAPRSRSARTFTS